MLFQTSVIIIVMPVNLSKEHTQKVNNHDDFMIGWKISARRPLVSSRLADYARKGWVSEFLIKAVRYFKIFHIVYARFF